MIELTSATPPGATTQPTKAKLLFILDRSGSMGTISNEAIGGFNAFVEGQKKVAGEATLSLVIFDNVIETVYDNIKLQDVPVLTNEVYFARGMTALYDAIGVTIHQHLKDADVNTKIILAILTDGDENSSQEYTGPNVAELIKKVETEHNWEVLFLGANIDVTKVATQLNIHSSKFASFAATGKGIQDSYSAINTVAGSYRTMSRSDVIAQNVTLSSELDKVTAQTTQSSI